METEKSSKIRNFFSSVSVGQVFLIVILFLGLLAINKTTDARYTYAIYGGLVIIILVLYFKSNPGRKLISVEEAKQCAQEYLEKLRRDGNEISFDSKVHVLPQCHPVYEDNLLTGQSGIVCYDCGFVEEVHGSLYRKEGVIKVHPYERIVTGLRWMNLGYTGRESSDVKIVPVGIINNNQNIK